MSRVRRSASPLIPVDERSRVSTVPTQSPCNEWLLPDLTAGHPPLARRRSSRQPSQRPSSRRSSRQSSRPPSRHHSRPPSSIKGTTPPSTTISITREDLPYHHTLHPGKSSDSTALRLRIEHVLLLIEPQLTHPSLLTLTRGPSGFYDDDYDGDAVVDCHALSAGQSYRGGVVSGEGRTRLRYICGPDLTVDYEVRPVSLEALSPDLGAGDEECERRSREDRGSEAERGRKAGNGGGGVRPQLVRAIAGDERGGEQEADVERRSADEGSGAETKGRVQAAEEEPTGRNGGGRRYSQDVLMRLARVLKEGQRELRERERKGAVRGQSMMRLGGRKLVSIGGRPCPQGSKEAPWRFEPAGALLRRSVSEGQLRVLRDASLGRCAVVGGRCWP